MPESSMNMPLVISVGSGKGGVGKTLTTVNMALAAQRMGYRTLVLDGDLGMANVDIVLGLRSRYNIKDVLDSKLRIEEILLEGPSGLKIIPSGSGVAQLTEMSFAKRVQLIEVIEEIASNYQVLFVDTGAGISSNVMHLNSISDALMVVTTPEPHAMTDAYAFLKVMVERHGQRNFNLVVNQVISEDQGLKIYKKLADVTLKFLGIKLKFGGAVPKDSLIERSVMLQQVADESVYHTRSGQAWSDIARRMIEMLKAVPADGMKRGLQDLLFPSLAQQNLETL